MGVNYWIMNSTTPEIVNRIQTGVGSFQTHKINHNPIREDGPYLIDEYVTKETIRTEVDWNENYFRYPIVKFGNEAKQVIKSDYLEEEFENGITRSIVYCHDDLICNEYTQTNVDVIKIMKDKETIIAEDKLSIHSTETRDSIDEMIIQDKELVIVKKDIQTPKIATEEIAQQSYIIATEQSPVNSGITIVITDVDTNVVEMDYVKKSDIKADKDKSKPSRVIVKRNKERRRTLETKDSEIEKAKQARIVKKETVTNTKTEKESYKITKKKQPLVVKTSSKPKQTKIKSRDGKMDVTGEDSSETAGIHDEHILLPTEEKMEISTKEIDIDEKIEGRVDQSDNTDTTGNITETEIVEQCRKSMEISKSYGQVEFGFHLYGRKNYDGHFISKVEPGSGAHKAGLKVGDQLIEIEGRSTDEMKHSEIVDIIKNSPGPLNVLVRNEIEKLKEAKKNIVLETEGDENKTSLDFSTKDRARPQRKQPPPSQNWKDKKKMFKNL